MYGDLIGWRAYALARGNNAPTAAEDVAATAALVRASDYIRFRYVANLLAAYDPLTFTPPGYTSPLVVEATYVAAAFDLTTPGFFSKTYTASEQKVLTGVGQIKWTVTGDSSKTYSAMPTSTLIDAMFEPYVIDRDDNSAFLWSIGPGSCL